METERRLERMRPCPYCAEDILKAAIRCKHCNSDLNVPAFTYDPIIGAPISAPKQITAPVRPVRPFRILFVLIVLPVLIVAISYILVFVIFFGPDHADYASSEQVTATISQQSFCDVIGDFRNQYNDASHRGANEAALSELRHSRMLALRNLLTNRAVSSWTGMVKTISTARNGEAKLTFLIPCSTKGNQSQNHDALQTLIDAPFFTDEVALWSQGFPRGTPIYQAIMGLKERQPVTLSGNFVVSDDNLDYARERSLTEDGSMTSPDFSFVFSTFHSLEHETATDAPVGRHHLRANKQSTSN